MKIYIAGPITNNPHYEEEFKKVEDVLKEKGHAVINPVKNIGFSYKDYIDMGLTELSKCDAIYVILNQHVSKGLCLEVRYALTVGLAVFANLDEVPRAPETEQQC